jgi:hypothetical protein
MYQNERVNPVLLKSGICVGVQIQAFGLEVGGSGFRV